MARTPSAMTVAIRAMFVETNGNITHSEARPKLVVLGHTVAQEPTDKSEAYQTFEAMASQYEYPNKGTEQEVREFYELMIEKADLPKNSLKAIMAEDAIYRAFKAERNNFDVCKSNWKNSSKATKSVKPAKGKVGRPAKVVAPVVAVRKPGRPPKVAATVASSVDGSTAAKFVVDNGGFAAVQAKIDSLNAEIAHFQAMIDAAKAFSVKLAA